MICQSFASDFQSFDRTVKRGLLDLRQLIAESGLILVLLEFCGYSKRYNRTVLLIGPYHERQQENNAKICPLYFQIVFVMFLASKLYMYIFQPILVCRGI